MKQNQINLDDLVNEGNKFSFENNSNMTYNEFYNISQHFSKATPEFLAWISKVEDYIISNYDVNSGPYKLISSVQKHTFNGNYKSEFDEELIKVKGAIISCKTIKPNKIKQDNKIISLLNNLYFWSVLVILIGASYKLGYDNGFAKYDNEKIEMNNQNIFLSDSINILSRRINQLQERINIMKNNDSINKNINYEQHN